MKHQLASLLTLVLFYIPSGLTISPASPLELEIKIEVTRGEHVANPVRLILGDADSHVHNRRAMDPKSGAYLNSLPEDSESNPTSSHNVVRPKNESSSPLTRTSLDGSPQAATSKTIPTKASDSEDGGEELAVTPFDHYHILGTRSGSSDSTLEKRRLCPAHPRPSGRGCTCPNQTLCRKGRHAPTCVQLKHDHENCGSCFNRCGLTQYCQGGKCHCERPNFSVCGRQCYNLKNNEEHCGKCGMTCGRGKTCVKGACKRK